MDNEVFRKRLTRLRMEKGVSARDMSLSIGQSPSYINNIENGVSLPSLSGFFYICDYLSITPSEFFDVDNTNPLKLTELVNSAKAMSNENLELLTALAKALTEANIQNEAR